MISWENGSQMYLQPLTYVHNIRLEILIEIFFRLIKVIKREMAAMVRVESWKRGFVRVENDLKVKIS